MLNNAENLAKAVTRLPNSLRNQNGSHKERLIDLVCCEKWFGDIITELFNPVAMIIAGKRSSNEQQHKIRNYYGNRRITCWLCSKEHKISACPDIVNASPLKDKGVSIENTCGIEGCKRHNTLLHWQNLSDVPNVKKTRYAYTVKTTLF